MARIAGEPSQSSAHRTGSGAPQEMEKTMYAVMGITGQVGGAVARELLAQGKGVRAVLRDADKGAPGVSKAVRCRLPRSAMSAR